MAHTGSPPKSSVSGAVGPAWDGRRNARLLVIGVAVLVPLAAVVVWDRVAAHRLDQVHVTWAGPPDCRGAHVVGRPERVPSAAGQDRWVGTVIAARRGMRCNLLVEVRNEGGGTVRVENALLPFMGPGGEPVIKVDTTSQRAAWDVSDEDDVDLTRMLDVTLEPDQTFTFEVPLMFRERGCSGSDGGMHTIPNFPAVAVSSLLHTSERTPLNGLRHVQAGPARGCDVHSN